MNQRRLRGLCSSRLVIWVLVTALLAASSSAAGAEEVVAVFNFAQRDDDPQYAWLSKGLADLLINQLSDLRNVSVVSRDRMQMLVSEYQKHRGSARGRPEMLREPPPAKMIQTLQANLVVFGTYKVEDGRATITAQISDARDERLMFETSVSGAAGEILGLEREIARRLRARLGGRRENRVKLEEVPQWTSHLGAVRHLYDGVDLFDQGLYADAWYRFRQAARAAPRYADALYWQGRMFYYMTMYENATPLLEQFLKANPRHPRAGDAVIELVDSARQTIDDAEAMLDVYTRAKTFCDDSVLVFNKTLLGQMPLNWYLEGQILQTLNHLKRYHELYARGLVWDAQTTRYSMGYDQRIDSELVRHFDYVLWAKAAAVKLMSEYDEEHFRKGMFSYHHFRFDLAGGLKDRVFEQVFPGRYGEQCSVQQVGNRYAIRGCGAGTAFVIAPPGYRMANLRLTMTPHHEENSTPLAVSVLAGDYGGDCIGRWQAMRTDAGPVTIDLPEPHRCRFVRLYYWINPADFSTTLHEKPVHDGLRSILLTTDFEPIHDEPGQLRVRVLNTTWIRAKLDGHPIDGDGDLIRGVAPGRHEIAVETGTEAGRRGVFAETTVSVDVQAEGVTECNITLPLRDDANPHHWSPPSNPRFKFPDYKLAPRSRTMQLCTPTLLRLTRGPNQGRLLTFWSYREQIWTSGSYDDGATWSQPEALPVPVNTAHVETAPTVIEAEDGRVCMAFLSDRGLHRTLCPYVTWTRDLATWSPPIKVADTYADDLQLVQDQSGRFMMVVSPPYRSHDSSWTYHQTREGLWELAKVPWETVAGEKYGRTATVMLTSDDLAEWRIMQHNLGTDETRRTRITQTADGTLHGLTIELTGGDLVNPNYSLARWVSREGSAWQREDNLFDRNFGDSKALSVTTDGKTIYGSVYWGSDGLIYFEWRPDGTVVQQDYTQAIGILNTVYKDPTNDLLHWFSGGEECRYIHSCRSVKDAGNPLQED